jgi:hypothetical protein
MKSLRRALALLLVAVAVLSALTGCLGGSVGDEGTATVVIERRDGTYAVYEVDLSKIEKKDSGMIPILDYLVADKNTDFTYKTNDTGYGAYITAIDTLTVDETKEYVAIYTTYESDFAVPSEWSPVVPTVTYVSITLTYSGVGLSSMHITDGTTVLFRVEGF